MFSKPFWTNCVVVVALLPCGAGCLLRKETIQVAADGSATIAIEYAGTREDWNTPDALPAAAGGWTITQERKTEGDKEEEIIERAGRKFPPEAMLPSSYAAPDDPDADLYLSFPTRIWREQRGDAVYLHFRRTYASRPWAYVQVWNGLCFDDTTKKLAEKKAEELSHEEQISLFRAAACFETLKQVELGQAALLKVAPDLPQDQSLVARKAMMDVFEQLDLDRFVGRLEQIAPEHRDDHLAREAEQVIERAYNAFKGSLRAQAGFDAERLRRFDVMYARQKKLHAITESVGSHAFEIRVTMPGRVVAHNAHEEEDDGAYVWQFQGDVVRDRPHELMITSRLDAGDRGK